MARYIQDHIMTFFFLFDNEECEATFANPIFEEECTFPTKGGTGTLTVQEIIDKAYKALDRSTGQEIIY